MFSRPPGYGEMPEPEPESEPEPAVIITRSAIIAAESPPAVGRALTAALAQLWPEPEPEPAARPVSTEGGQGRAVPGHGSHLGDLAADQGKWVAVADTGADSAWLQRPRR